MPLPRLDDDQKYWEERCHALEKELAQAREKALEEGLNLLLTEYGEFRKGGCSPNEALDRAEIVVRNHVRRYT